MVALGIDDDGFMREIQETLFAHVLGLADDAYRTFGATDDEISSFVDCALGQRHLSDLRPVAATETQAERPHPAESSSLDQNIERDGGASVLGTDLAAELAERSFGGVVAILTASSKHEMDRIATLPGVDLVFEKGERLQDIARCLLACLHAKRTRLARAALDAAAPSAAPPAAPATPTAGEVDDSAVLDLEQFDGMQPEHVRRLLRRFCSASRTARPPSSSSRATRRAWPPAAASRRTGSSAQQRARARSSSPAWLCN
jgi:hypothetical protein